MRPIRCKKYNTLKFNDSVYFISHIFKLFISATDVDNLVNLVRNTNFKLLLDLNLQQRYGQQWDPSNTANLLGHITRNKYQDVLNFELGNGKFSQLSLAALVNQFQCERCRISLTSRFHCYEV